MKSETVIVVHESIAESAMKDFITTALAACLIGFGVYVGSNLMQWFGFIMMIAIVFAWASGARRKSVFTPDEAIAKINEIKEGMKNDSTLK